MTHRPESVLDALRHATPRLTREAPQDARGVYGLIDHLGSLRYIGSTSAANETLFKRIHQRHRTGSEDASHYFSRMYNTGRMWRDASDLSAAADGTVAKALRNAFVADHCRAIWVPLPDTVDIVRLEAAVLALAAPDEIAWNRRGMPVYAEPVELVDATLRALGWSAGHVQAVERQQRRFGERSGMTSRPAASVAPLAAVPPFPAGPVRFFALDVETANNDRASICQIGIACVRDDNQIDTWVTYVDPRTDLWLWSGLHGITADTVRDAPTFAELLPMLDAALGDRLVFQHSTFDRSAVKAACERDGLAVPEWSWRDSVPVARAAWPELRGNGGHGLANLQRVLGLEFRHHDAGEDARASAEVVLRAETIRPGLLAGLAVERAAKPATAGGAAAKARRGQPVAAPVAPRTPAAVSVPEHRGAPRQIGTSQLTQANIVHAHIYLRGFIDMFPADAIGGPNRESAAAREISIDWGNATVEMSDLDGTKKLFRRRSWVRGFFKLHGAAAGDVVSVEELGPYAYRVSIVR